MQLCFHSTSVWIRRFIKPKNPARVCMQQGQDDPSRADLTFVVPGLHGKLDLILRQSSWRWNCPKTAGHTDYKCLGIEGESHVPGSLLPGFWEWSLCLLVSGRCGLCCWCWQGIVSLQDFMTPHAVTTKLQSVDVSALFYLKGLFLPFQSVDYAIFLLAYTAIAKIQ